MALAITRNEEFFGKLDANFKNYAGSNEPLIFQSKDCLVQWHFELPIPTQPGSVVKYTFMTTIGDISFGAHFVDKNDETPEILIEACRVPSDVEPIMGSFRARREGTLILTFDNSYSWFNPKLLTYKVALFQPPFYVADESRSIRSRHLLNGVMDEIKKSEQRLVTAQDHFLDMESNILSVEEKIAALQEELIIKKESLMKAIDEAQELTDRIYSNLERRNGLCIRCLTKPALTIVLAFLGGSKSPAVFVCKYWYVCCKEWERATLQPKVIENVAGGSDALTANEDEDEDEDDVEG